MQKLLKSFDLFCFFHSFNQLTTASHSHKDGSSDRSVLALAELIPQRDDYRTDSQHTHHRDVRDFGLAAAVETVVYPGNEGADDEQRDAHVVEFTEDFDDADRVTRESVEGE